MLQASAVQEMASSAERGTAVGAARLGADQSHGSGGDVFGCEDNSHTIRQELRWDVVHSFLRFLGKAVVPFQSDEGFLR